MKHFSVILFIACIVAGAAAAHAQNTAVKSVCPAELAVSAPFTINEGDPLTFAVEGPVTSSLSLQLSYVWTISPSSVRVLSGVGTPSITVATTKQRGKRITVRLAVEGGSKEKPCRLTADAATTVVAPRTAEPPHKFDEFLSAGLGRDKAQLDRLAAFLRNSPEAGAFLVAYSACRSSPAKADRLGTSARNYLLKSSVISGIEPMWIVAVNGGHRERDSYEFWIVPRGAQPPAPTPRDCPASAASNARQKSGR
jgi:hypothetical protein